MANVVVKLSGQHSAAILKASLAQANDKSRLPDVMKSLVEAMGPFESRASVQILNDDAVAASATVTLDFSKQTADDTIQVGAMILTAKASGASTNEFNIGASNAASALNLATAISSYSNGLLLATPAGAVVTVKARSAGIQGNAIPIILSQVDVGMVASAVALSGGSEDSAVAKDYRAL